MVSTSHITKYHIESYPIQAGKGLPFHPSYIQLKHRRKAKDSLRFEKD